MAEDLLPFDRAASDARTVMTELGQVASRVEALYDDAEEVAKELTAALRTRGQPEGERATMEYNLLGLWLQAVSTFTAEYLRATLLQGSQIAAAPRLSIADARSLRGHRPDRGRLH